MPNRLQRNQKRNIKRKQHVSLERARLESKVYEEELESGLLLVDRIQKDRARMIKEIENELTYQQQLRDKINYLKEQYKVLRASYDVNAETLMRIKDERVAMETEATHLEQEMESTEMQINGNIIEGNYAVLMSRLSNNTIGHPKERSILLSVLKELIQTTNENEFEGFNWKAKIAYSSSSVGARVRFTGLAIRRADLNSIYEPVMKSFEKSYANSGIMINTKSRKENGVITTLDITVKVPFKIQQRRAELP